jgi:hypothetical protein
MGLRKRLLGKRLKGLNIMIFTLASSYERGMDQGSDFISDFNARRIRTQITCENLSANCHEVTVTYLKPVSSHARRWLRHC